MNFWHQHLVEVHAMMQNTDPQFQWLANKMPPSKANQQGLTQQTLDAYLEAAQPDMSNGPGQQQVQSAALSQSVDRSGRNTFGKQELVFSKGPPFPGAGFARPHGPNDFVPPGVARPATSTPASASAADAAGVSTGDTQHSSQRASKAELPIASDTQQSASHMQAPASDVLQQAES